MMCVNSVLSCDDVSLCVFVSTYIVSLYILSGNQSSDPDISTPPRSSRGDGGGADSGCGSTGYMVSPQTDIWDCLSPLLPDTVCVTPPDAAWAHIPSP